MASEKVSQVLEVLDSMTLLEFNELKETFKEKFGVTAAVAMPMGGGVAAPAAGGDGAAPAAAEEATEFTVVLKEFGAKKLDVIKAVREVAPNLGLKEAKDLVEGAPADIPPGSVSKEEAQRIREKLEAAGATVDVKAA